MNYKTWTVGIAVLTLAAAPAFAETSTGQWSYDQNVLPVGCCGDDCCGDSCCGDDCCGDDCCCGDGCCDCGSSCCGGVGLFSGMGPGVVEGFSLASMLGIDAWEVGGWTEFGWTDDAIPLSPQGSNGSGLSFRDVPDRLNLDQQWFYVGKQADGSNGFDLGFRADFVYGTDAQRTQSFGNPPGAFDEGWDHGVYGWAIPQLYGEVAMGDFSVKIGHFFTVLGYEVVPSPQNFFYSHSLTMFNSEPFTHTGVLGSYSGFENITMYSGWTLGWDTGFDNVNSGNNYLGGFTVDLLDAVSLSAFTTYGNFGAINTGGDTDNRSSSVVFDVAVTNAINYVFQTDYKKIDNASDEDIGINQYLFFNFNDAIAFGNRIEWWRNDQVSNYEYTTGLNIKLLDNLIMRPEYRTDWVPATDFSVENVACDMILTY